MSTDLACSHSCTYGLSMGQTTISLMVFLANSNPAMSSQWIGGPWSIIWKNNGAYFESSYIIIPIVSFLMVDIEVVNYLQWMIQAALDQFIICMLKRTLNSHCFMKYEQDPIHIFINFLQNNGCALRRVSALPFEWNTSPINHRICTIFSCTKCVCRTHFIYICLPYIKIDRLHILV